MMRYVNVKLYKLHKATVHNNGTYRTSIIKSEIDIHVLLK